MSRLAVRKADYRSKKGRRKRRASRIKAVVSEGEEEEEEVKEPRAAKEAKEPRAAKEAKEPRAAKAEKKKEAKEKAAKGKIKAPEPKEEEEEEAFDIDGSTLGDLYYEEIDPESIKFLRVDPDTYCFCSEVKKRFVKDREQDLADASPYKGTKYGRTELRDPKNGKKDRPYYGSAPHIRKALVQDLCQKTYWPENKFKQPFKKWTRLATPSECLSIGRAVGWYGASPDVKKEGGEEEEEEEEEGEE